MTDENEKVYQDGVENIKKFVVWVGGVIVHTERYVSKLVGKVGREGWRPSFCWFGGAVILFALKTAFIDIPSTGIVPPEHFYAALNVAFGIMGGVLGVRGIEKGYSTYLATEQTRRLEQ